MIDLDANATTRMLPEVVDAMLPWLRDHHANPSGSYRGAKLARKAIEQAREQVADLISAAPEEIVFTGCGTESVNTALHSLDVLTGKGAAMVSAIEHSAVLRQVERSKRDVRLVKVDAAGLIEEEDFAEACDTAAFVSVMLANNEIGVIQPIAKLLEIARAKGLPFHTDAIQAVGKIPLSVKDIPVDMLSISAHKFHGPKGIGALYVRSGVDFSPLLVGGGQESGRRSGTENTAAIVAMGKAAELAKQALDSGLGSDLATMRDLFQTLVMEGVSGCTLNGAVISKLPNTTHLSFRDCDAAGMLILLDEAGLACSAGSACMTGKRKPSHVQLAMGLSEAMAKTSLRFSFSRFNTLPEAAQAAQIVIKAVQKLRAVQGGGIGPVAIYTQ
ncbi:MAG: cysteine desulfurase family protein [Verrucomicrobiota bacterium]